MFFLGSTGPILTLVLTVLLPAFLLTAKHHEVSFEQETFSTNVLVQTIDNIQISDKNSTFLKTDKKSSAIIREKPGFLILKFILNKPPGTPPALIYQSEFLNFLWNKAPPHFVTF